jgi:histidinol-phosphatase (PHP family)
LIDYHLHTARCGHAVGELDEYVRRAADLGFREIGFADHLPLFHTIDSTLAMSWDEYPLYLADIKRLKNQVERPRIKLGIEVDYLPEHLGQINDIIQDEEFDYVLGSVHFVDGWGIDDPRYLAHYDDYDLEDLYGRYFTRFIEAAESGSFDIMAHPDLIKKYFKLAVEPIDLYERAAQALAAAGTAIELSSAGWRKPCGEPYPSRRFLEVCRRHRVELTLGSDAHAPEQVGFAYKRLLLELKEAGYSEVLMFTGRQKEKVKIDWSMLERLPTT